MYPFLFNGSKGVICLIGWKTRKEAKIKRGGGLFMKISLPIFLFLSCFVSNTWAAPSWSRITQNLEKVGGSAKSLSHLKCFYSQYRNSIFNLSLPSVEAYSRRCSYEGELRVSDHRYATIIDYTLRASKRRMFLIDFKTSDVFPMGVAHGRFKSGYMRLRTSKNKNSITRAKYFSNTPNTNAPSSGFFFAGQEYQGKFGRSMILHGLEKGINDNACERAVVIHKHLMVSKRRAYVMSSGCPMVSRSYIDRVINSLKGEQSGIDLKRPGGVVFIYGPREKKWTRNSCPLSLL
jgi:hypothetical protein